MAIGNWLEKPALRQALQTAIGVAAAIGAGTLVSGQRWYWAVIAAFIIALGVGSRGEALVKALQRVAGTLFGIGVGIGLATLVNGDKFLTMGLVFVCVFFAFYAFQTAYGVMIFFITLMLALLYGLIGMFRPELLVLRLEETAVGAAIGLLAVTTILPMRQNSVFADAANAYRLALAEALRVQVSGDDRSARAALRELQSKTQNLRTAVGAVKRGWAPLVGRHYRHTVRAAMHCSYLVREMAQGRAPERDFAEALARRLLRDPADEDGQLPPAHNELEEAISDAAARLRRQLAQILPDGHDRDLKNARPP